MTPQEAAGAGVQPWGGGGMSGPGQGGEPLRELGLRVDDEGESRGADHLNKNLV